MDKMHKIRLSTEILSAYMDNNLSAQDMEFVANFINGNSELMDICTMNDMVEESIAANSSVEIPIEFSTDGFPIPSLEEIMSSDNDKIGVYEELIDDFYSEVSGNLNEDVSENFAPTDISNESPDTIHISNKNHLDMENQDLLNVGYKANASQNTYNPKIYQGFNPSCAVCSQDVILRDFGIKIPREELIKFATKQGWYDPDPNHGGTPKECVGNILDACGIETTRYENACFGDLVRELSAGHRVIVSVDADELWINKEKGMFNHLFGEVKNKVSDAVENALGIEGANHALVVAGLNINPKDPQDIRVVLIDTGYGDYCIEYSWKQFSDALADSHNYLIATKEAAPYQYNYNTDQFEPSGFKSNFVPSMAHLPEGLNNEFSLPDNFYEQFKYFEPFFNINHPLRPLGINIISPTEDGNSIEDKQNTDENSDDNDHKNDPGEEPNSEGYGSSNDADEDDIDSNDADQDDTDSDDDTQDEDDMIVAGSSDSDSCDNGDEY